MKKIKPLLIFSFAIIILFQDCKKEENGNHITLTTKKHRLTERWTMTRGKVGITEYINGSAYNSNFELTQGQGILTQTGTYIAYTFSYNLYLEFKNAGDFAVTEDFNGLTMTANGKWDFNKKTEEQERKSAVLLSLTNISSGKVDDHLFNHFVNDIEYSIKVLSKDELKISSSTTYLYQGKDKWSVQSEYTLKKQ